MTQRVWSYVIRPELDLQVDDLIEVHTAYGLPALILALGVLAGEFSHLLLKLYDPSIALI